MDFGQTQLNNLQSQLQQLQQLINRPAPGIQQPQPAAPDMHGPNGGWNFRSEAIPGYPWPQFKLRGF